MARFECKVVEIGQGCRAEFEGNGLVRLVSDDKVIWLSECEVKALVMAIVDSRIVSGQSCPNNDDK